MSKHYITCGRCDKDLEIIKSSDCYTSDIDGQLICKECFLKEQPKELAKQLAELKAENKQYQNGMVLDGDAKIKQWRKIADVCKENRKLKAENERLNTELARKTTKINQFDEIIKDNYVDGQDYDKLKNDYEQQLKEKDEKIEKLKEELDDKNFCKDFADLYAENKLLRQGLRANTKQVCEKIRRKSEYLRNKDWCGQYSGNNAYFIIGDNDLDQIEKGEI